MLFNPTDSNNFFNHDNARCDDKVNVRYEEYSEVTNKTMLRTTHHTISRSYFINK